MRSKRYIVKDWGILRPRWIIGIGFFCGVTIASGAIVSSYPLSSDHFQTEQAAMTTIPLLALNVDQAIATVSVLQEPPSAAGTLVKICQSGIPQMLQENFQLEGENLEEEMKKICTLVRRMLPQSVESPVQDLDPQEYRISVPMNIPRQEMQSVVWVAHSLDQAIAFVHLLQSGALQAVTVYERIPWSASPTKPCSSCPIKELIFHARHMKEQLELLQGKSKDGLER